MGRGSVIFLFLFAGFFISKPLKAQVIGQDSLALIDFYISTSGDDWLIPWDTTKAINEWFGVSLNEDNSRVVGISLPNNQLNGQITGTLSQLDKLTTLVLSDNQISGTIPSTLGVLDTMLVLDLSGNFLSDTIPEEIGALGFLKTLDLSSNELQGNIPVSFGNLDSLRILNLSLNELSGAIPNELGNLDSLNTINISENNFLGPVPNFLQNLKVLREIDLSSNSIDGELPSFWADLTQLRILRLDDNQIEGTIPDELGNLLTLFTLDLAGNLLEGVIPNGIGSIDSLRTLDLSNNNLDQIPSTLSNLSKIERLDLSQNEFSGDLFQFSQIPAFLEILDLHGNEFTGNIPGQYGDILTLKELNLSFNQLVDSIPSSFLNLTNLESLDLSNNQLEALNDISSLDGTGSLQQFHVSNNRLGFEDLEINYLLFNDSTDYSPQSRINDTLNVAVPTGNLYTLSVSAGGSANKYRWIFESYDSLIQVGFLPENFEFSIDNFQEENSGSYSCEIISDLVPGLTLKRNPINLFPAINTSDSLALIEFNNTTGGTNWINKWDVLSEPVFTWQGVEIDAGSVVGIRLEDNNLQGYINDTIGLLQNLRILDLSGNNIEDSIPPGLANLVNLKILDLSNNKLSGIIPETFSNMDSLLTLNLSRNQLEGNLINQFDSLFFLKVLDLSDNDLTGTIQVNLSTLPSLEILALGENRFSGVIPEDIGLLSNLIILDLSENRLSGEIPEAISLLTKLEEVKLFRNQLSGALPEAFINSTSIERLFINDNRISSLPNLSTFQFENLELRVFNNILTFKDFVDNFNGFNNEGQEDEFLFLPQPTIINSGTITLQKDESTILTIPDAHPDNKFEWLKEGTALNIESPQLNIDSAKIESSGIYIGQVWTTNSNFSDEINTATDSLVFNFTYTVLVAPPIPEITPPEPFCIGGGTVTLVNDFGAQTGLISRWYDIHPSSGGVPVSENPAYVHQISGASDTVYVTNGLGINKTFESPEDTIVIISKPWILDKGDFLEAAPSDSLLNSRWPENTITSTYQWFVNESLISGQSGPTLQKSVDGQYHVRIIRQGCSSTSDEYLPPDSNLVLGLNDGLNDRINIYPNPAGEVLHIISDDQIQGPVNILIFDLRGELVFNEPIRQEVNNFGTSINISALNPGLYIVQIHLKEGPVTRRIIKE